MPDVTYADELPSVIRMGDKVTDHLNRTFYAYSDAVEDQMGMWNVLTADGKYYAYEIVYDRSGNVVSYDPVTVTYAEVTEYDYA